MNEPFKPLHLTPAETAARLRVSVTTLARWRMLGATKGHTPPRFLKFGKKVFYSLAELDAYEARQLRSHNAQS